MAGPTCHSLPHMQCPNRSVPVGLSILAKPPPRVAPEMQPVPCGEQLAQYQREQDFNTLPAMKHAIVASKDEAFSQQVHPRECMLE